MEPRRRLRSQWAAEPQSAPREPASAEELLETALPATVLVATDSLEGVGVGAGFFLNDQGMIATAYHLMEEIDLAEVWTHDGKVHMITKILAADPAADVAIFQTTAKGYPALPIATSMALKPGHKVITVGHPGALEWSVSEGLLSATDRLIDGLPWIQHTAPMSGGNSGGPLISLTTGQVIGLNTFLLTGQAIQNLNFAAPATTIAEVFNRGGTGGLSLPGRLTDGSILPPPSDLPPDPDKPPVTITGAWLHPRGDLMNRGVASVTPGTTFEHLWSHEQKVHGGRLLLSDGILYAVDSLSSATIVAFEAGTGKRLWEHRLSRFATPAVAGPLGVYVTEMHYAVTAFRPDGTTLWSQPVTAATMPVLVSDSLYVVDGKGVVRALKPETGEEVWNLPLGPIRFASVPAVYKGMLLLAADGQVYAVDLKSGSLVRTYPTRMTSVSSIMVDHDLLYVTGYDGLRAFHLESGELAWHAQIGLLLSPPASGGGLVVVANLDNRLFAFDAKTGKQVWVQVGGGRGAPVIAGSQLYVGVPTGGLGVYDLATGKREALLLPGVITYLTPVLTPDAIFIGASQWGIHALIRRE